MMCRRTSPPPYPPHKGEGENDVKRLALSEGTTHRARTLRRDATDAERLLWRALRENFATAHFRRQVPLGPYFADFASHRHRLVIEVDGGQHGVATTYDATRTAFLESQGYRVIRFWNPDVLHNIEGTITQIGIALALQTPPPCGEGQGGGPPASAGEKTSTPADSATPSWAADATRPHPYPPHKGEGA